MKELLKSLLLGWACSISTMLLIFNIDKYDGIALSALLYVSTVTGGLSIYYLILSTNGKKKDKSDLL